MIGLLTIRQPPASLRQSDMGLDAVSPTSGREPAVVYQDDDMEVIFRPSASPVLLATFNPAGFQADGTRFWGARQLSEFDYGALGFMSRRVNWFPAASMRAAAIATRSLRDRFASIASLGFSLGAYGALKYGRLLGARVSIAFSPHSPTLRAAEPGTFESEAPELYAGLDVARDDLAPRAFLLVDPLQPLDRASARMLLDLDAGCVLIPTYASGHLNILPVVRAGVLGQLIAACLGDDRAALHALWAQARRGHRARPVMLATLTLPRRPALSAELYRRHADCFAPRAAADLHIDLAHAWLDAGQHEAALLAVESAARLAAGERGVRGLLDAARAAVASFGENRVALACWD
jgi:hypothetical protein